MPAESMLLAICLMLLATTARAEPDETVPDAALLEFLGEWSDANGEFVDPLLFVDTDDNPAQAAGGETSHDQKR